MRRVEGVVVLLKIRIFALARELGLDSKVLLGLCDDAGVKLRNALATITPEERDKIVAYVKGRDVKVESPAAKPEDLAPTRDVNAGKVRDIRTLPPKVAKESTAQTITSETIEEPSVDPVTSVTEEPELPSSAESETKVEQVPEVVATQQADVPEDAPVAAVADEVVADEVDANSETAQLVETSPEPEAAPAATTVPAEPPVAELPQVKPPAPAVAAPVE